MTPRASIAGRTAKEEEVISAVRKYNEDLMRSKVSGPDVAPPVPLKKKTSKYILAILKYIVHSVLEPLEVHVYSSCQEYRALPILFGTDHHSAINFTTTQNIFTPLSEKVTSLT